MIPWKSRSRLTLAPALALALLCGLTAAVASQKPASALDKPVEWVGTIKVKTWQENTDVGSSAEYWHETTYTLAPDATFTNEATWSGAVHYSVKSYALSEPCPGLQHWTFYDGTSSGAGVELDVTYSAPQGGYSLATGFTMVPVDVVNRRYDTCTGESTDSIGANSAPGPAPNGVATGDEDAMTLTGEFNEGTAALGHSTQWNLRRVNCDEELDTDGGGVGDCLEVDQGSDPTNPDDDQEVDTDGDGVFDVTDNCPSTPNSDQADLDRDGMGDVCDADIDGDGLSNEIEIATGLNPHNPDTDGDGHSDGTDNCAKVPNTDQTDTDGDGIGNACYTSPSPTAPAIPSPSSSPCPSPDPDPDGDGLGSCLEKALETNHSNIDTDGDGVSDGIEHLLHGTDPLDRDTDDGSVNDGREILLRGSNPLDGGDDIPLPYDTLWRNLADMAAHDYQVAEKAHDATAGYYRQVLNLVCSAAGVSRSRPANQPAMRACPGMKKAVGSSYGNWAGDFPYEVFRSFLPTVDDSDILGAHKKIKRFGKAVCFMTTVTRGPLGGHACMARLRDAGFAIAGAAHAAHHLYPSFVRHARNLIASASGGSALQQDVLRGNLAVMRDQHKKLFKHAVKPGFVAVYEVSGVFKWIATKFVPFAASCERENAIRDAFRAELGRVRGDALFVATDDSAAHKKPGTLKCRTWMKVSHAL